MPDDASKIDADYVNRVLAALNHIRGDLARKQLATGQLSEAALIPLRAMYSDSELPIQAQIVVKSVVPPRERLRDPVGDPRLDMDSSYSRCPPTGGGNPHRALLAGLADRYDPGPCGPNVPGGTCSPRSPSS